MNYPKYFHSKVNDALYVFNSKKEETDGVRAIYIHGGKPTRGVLPWLLSEMKVKDGFKPATVAQIRRFIPDYKPAPRIGCYRLKGGFHSAVAYFIVKGNEVTRVLKDGTEEIAEEEFSLPIILGWVKSGSWERVPLSEARKEVAKTPPKSELDLLKEENLRLRAIIAASKKELEKA